MQIPKANTAESTRPSTPTKFGSTKSSKKIRSKRKYPRRYTELFTSIVQEENESTIFTQIFTGNRVNGVNENHWVPTYLRKHEERNTVVT